MRRILLCATLIALAGCIHEPTLSDKKHQRIKELISLAIDGCLGTMTTGHEVALDININMEVWKSLKEGESLASAKAIYKKELEKFLLHIDQSEYYKCLDSKWPTEKQIIGGSLTQAKKELKPILSFVYRADSNKDMGLQIKNVGNGPAVNLKIEYSVDNEEFNALSNGNVLDTLLNRLGINKKWLHHEIFEAAQGIAKGEQFWIFKVSFEDYHQIMSASNRHENIEDILRGVLHRLTIKFSYEDMNKKTFSESSKEIMSIYKSRYVRAP